MKILVKLKFFFHFAITGTRFFYDFSLGGTLVKCYGRLSAGLLHLC